MYGNGTYTPEPPLNSGVSRENEVRGALNAAADVFYPNATQEQKDKAVEEAVRDVMNNGRH